MKKILVTGSRGFVGKNLLEALSRREDVKIASFDSSDDLNALPEKLEDVDLVFHLAGANRPERVEDYEKINTNLTANIVSELQRGDRTPAIVFTSSTQALSDNPYGASKKSAEAILADYHQNTGALVHIYRLTNIFGKWCRPNYNSVVATFCYNISHDLEISISDRNSVIELVYIDDVIASFIGIIDGARVDTTSLYHEIGLTKKITLGELAERILQFHDVRKSLIIPDLADDFSRRLFSTYLSYLDRDGLSYVAETMSDDRGSLTELFKSRSFGQIFVSTTETGVTRGNHYHDSKIEKFIVLKGDARITLRSLLDNERISYVVSGKNIQLVDVPPGYTHAIENVGDDEMLVLFWAGEIYDQKNPDTYYREV